MCKLNTICIGKEYNHSLITEIMTNLGSNEI